MQVTKGRLYDARVTNQLDPLYKNVLRRQNPYEIVLKDISKFDGQNPVTGSLLVEIESEKLTYEVVPKFLDGTPSTKDLEIRKGPKDLKSFKKKLVTKNEIVGAELPLNNDSDSDDSVNENNDGGYHFSILNYFPTSPNSFQKLSLGLSQNSRQQQQLLKQQQRQQQSEQIFY